jgi:uncharacterized membrane protein SpoIIM required for sporulation
LKRLRRNLALASGLWVAGMLAGGLGVLLTTSSDGGAAVDVLPRTSVTAASAFVGILGRNLAVYTALVGGLLCAGITSVALLLYNGVLLGGTLVLAWLVGVAPERIFLALAPHAVLELPALILGGSIGLMGASEFRRWIRDRGTLSIPRDGRLAVLALAGALALVIAAAIEAWVSLAASSALVPG